MDGIRQQKGQMLIELLIASVVGAIVASAFLAVLLVNFKSYSKVTNMSETASAVRIIKERIGKDVRMGRTLGDVYGAMVVDSSVSPAVTIIGGTSSFPSNLDPVYGTGATPPNGWPSTTGVNGGPAWPTVSLASPLVLNNQTLIVQIPVTDLHRDSGSTHVDPPLDGNGLYVNPGFPTVIPGASAPSGHNEVNVETHVYKILPDLQNSGEWVMSYCAFPGMAKSGSGTNAAGTNYTYDYVPAAHQFGPETIITGIIGPLDSGGNPKVFQFVDKTDTSGTPVDSIPNSGLLVSNYTGIVVNLEVRKHDTSSLTQQNHSLQPIAFKVEVYLRNNAMATPTGTPQSM